MKRIVTLLLQINNFKMIDICLSCNVYSRVDNFKTINYIGLMGPLCKALSLDASNIYTTDVKYIYTDVIVQTGHLLSSCIVSQDEINCTN